MSEVPFNKKISVDTRFPEWDGYITLSLSDGVADKEVKVDLLSELTDIEKSLTPNEQVGTAFGNAVQRHMWVKHGVKISVTSAIKLYNDMVSMAREINDFFSPMSGSPTISEPDSMPETSAPDSSDSGQES